MQPTAARWKANELAQSHASTCRDGDIHGPHTRVCKQLCKCANLPMTNCKPEMAQYQKQYGCGNVLSQYLFVPLYRLCIDVHDDAN